MHRNTHLWLCLSAHRKIRSLASSSSGSLFAAADEFADLLDEEGDDQTDTITSHAVVNKGKSGKNYSCLL